MFCVSFISIYPLYVFHVLNLLLTGCLIIVSSVNAVAPPLDTPCGLTFYWRCAAEAHVCACMKNVLEHETLHNNHITMTNEPPAINESNAVTPK